MGKYYAFHKTVKGYLHGKKKIPCEDCSESFFMQNADERKEFYIAVVADGHGDKACMRSELGSKKVAEIAKNCLKEFAKDAVNNEQESKDKQNADKYKGYVNIADMLANAAVYGKDAKDTLKARVPESLTNMIVSRWQQFVDEDICERPLSEEEMAQASQYADAYREGKRLKHIYGTTLIAALMLPDYLLLIQQGDGRCDVFYENDDGEVEVAQPIPWDERCHENVTTSMCDEDVFLRIRSRVIDLREKKVIACFLGTDGVEDAYRDMEGTHMFYRSLAAELVERGTDAFENYLEEMLPKFSENGSGDDVSVSGIVDIEHVKNFVPIFQMQNKQYHLKDDLDRYESRIISMSRKHGILRENVDEAKKEYEKLNNQLKGACEGCNKVEEKYREAVAKADKWKQVWKKWENELDELKNKRRKTIDVPNIFNTKWSKSRFSIPQDSKNIYLKQIKERENSMKKYYPDYMKAGEIETKLYDKLCEQKENKISVEQSLKSMNKQLQKAQQEFEEYDQQYQSIQAEIERIKREITLLDEEKKHFDSHKYIYKEKNEAETNINTGFEQKQEQAKGSNSVLDKEVNSQGSECYSAEIQEKVERSSDSSQNLQGEDKTPLEKREDIFTDFNLQEKVDEKIPADFPRQQNIETIIPKEPDISDKIKEAEISENSDKVNQIKETEIQSSVNKFDNQAEQTEPQRNVENFDNQAEQTEPQRNVENLDNQTKQTEPQRSVENFDNQAEQTEPQRNVENLDNQTKQTESQRSVENLDKIEKMETMEGQKEINTIQFENAEQIPIRFSENDKSDIQ